MDGTVVKKQIAIDDIPAGAIAIYYKHIPFFWDSRFQQLQLLWGDIDLVVVEQNSFKYVDRNDLSIPVGFVVIRCQGRDYQNCFDDDKTSSVALFEQPKEDLYKWLEESKSVKNVLVADKIVGPN